MEFKDRLKLLRKEKKLTQESLGRAIHISRSAIAKWEAGIGLPSEDSVLALCAFFHVDQEELFPDLRVEELLVSKNVKIKQHKQRNAILLAILFALISIISAWQAFSWLGYIKGEKVKDFLREYIPTLTRFYLPSSPFVLGPYSGEEYRYVIQKGQFVEVYFDIEVDKLFSKSWVEVRPKFKDLIVTSAHETRRLYNEDTCIIEYSTFIRVDSESITEVRLSNAVFAHVVEGIRYEKECLIEPREQSVLVKDIWIKNLEIYREKS